MTLFLEVTVFYDVIKGSKALVYRMCGLIRILLEIWTLHFSQRGVWIIEILSR